MSVINTMLKDLESRGVECSTSDNNVLGGLSANRKTISEEKLFSNAYFISVLSVFSVLTIIIAIYYLLPYKMVSVVQGNVAAPLVSAVPSAVETQVKHKSAVLNPVMMEQEQEHAAVVEKPVVVRAAAPIQAPVPAAINRVVAAERETQPASKVTDIALVVQSTDQQSSDAEESVAEEKPQIKTPLIKQAAKIQPVITSVPILEPVLDVVENFDEDDEASDSLQVVNKTQRDYTPQEKSRQAYATASTLFNKGSKQQAKTLLKEAIAYSNSNRDAFSLLAVIYLEEGRADLASEIIENGLSIHDKDQPLLRLYLQSLVQQAKYKEATTVMEQRLHLTSPEDLGYLAGLYQKQNDHLNAVKFYARALQLKPSTSLWWVGQGISLEGIEKYKEALQSYQQSISTGQLSGQVAQYAITRMNTIKQLHADFIS